MPIEIQGSIRQVRQDEFARIAYEVMGHFFELHKAIGRLFCERIYAKEVARRYGAARTNVGIAVSYLDYCKRYLMDLVVAEAAVFEVKAVETLTRNHRAQLLNYLLMAGLTRGKLVNVRPDSIQHEFVNACISHEERTDFVVDDGNWVATSDADPAWKSWITAALRDWGTGLDVSLYRDAIAHAMGGAELVLRRLPVVIDGETRGFQTDMFTGPASVVRVTAFPNDDNAYATHLDRYVHHTRLQSVHWLNIARRRVTFRTVRSDRRVGRRPVLDGAAGPRPEDQRTVG